MSHGHILCYLLRMPTTKPPRPPNACSACGRPVVVRRPSKTGTHWCSDTLCQRERTKFYKNNKIKTAVDHQKRALEEMEQRWNDAVTIGTIIATQERITCPTCGVEDALDVLPHPSAEGPKCLGTANPAGALLMMPLPLVQAIWPRVAP